MTPVETLRVILFLGVVVLVYVLSAGILARYLSQRLGLTQTATPRRQIWSRRFTLGLAALGTCCIAYGFFIEPYWLDVSHVRITTSKLSAGARPLRIVHISDLHCEARPRLESRLPSIVAREKPDLIVFTGDAINSPAGLPVFRSCLTQLAAIAPTFAVRGNWDAWYWPDLNLFGGTGARELNGQGEKMNVRGVPVWVGGIPVEGEDRMPFLLHSVPPEVFSILLYHYPDEIDAVAQSSVDLYFAGHTHGGQLALPFYGALVTLSKHGKTYEAGLYHVGHTWLNVNRGLGMEGGRMPRVRFCARPEVTVLEVVPERAQARRK